MFDGWGVHSRAVILGGGIMVVMIAAAALATFTEKWAANVGFLIVGAGISLIGGLVHEWAKAPYARRDLIQLLYLEVADRTARCLYDYVNTWQGLPAVGSGAVDSFRLRKFRPLPPDLFRASAARLHMLDSSFVEAVLHFQYQLSAWDRDLENVAARLDLNGARKAGSSSQELLRHRLYETLGPGLRVLELFGAKVDGTDRIEAEALARYDTSSVVKTTLQEALRQHGKK